MSVSKFTKRPKSALSKSKVAVWLTPKPYFSTNKKLYMIISLSPPVCLKAVRQYLVPRPDIETSSPLLTGRRLDEALCKGDAEQRCKARQTFLEEK